MSGEVECRAQSTDLLYIRISGFQRRAGGRRISLMSLYSEVFHRMFASVHSWTYRHTEMLKVKYAWKYLYLILDILNSNILIAVTHGRLAYLDIIYSFILWFGFEIFPKRNCTSNIKPDFMSTHQIQPNVCCQNLILLVLKLCQS